MSGSLGKITGGNYETKESYDNYMNNLIKNNSLSYNNETQFAQNNNIATDTLYANNPNYISDEDLYAKMWENIKKHEGFPANPYLDTKGNITVGAGANINDKEDFMKVNFMINGRPITDAEKEQYYNLLHNMSMEVDDNYKFKYHNISAENFARYTPLKITDKEGYRLAQNHMTDDLAHVRRQFSDFDNFPLPLKEVLLDIQYNTGGLNQNNWPHLYEAIKRKDILGKDGIAVNIHRKDVGKERNDWAEQLVKSIRF